MSTGLLERPPVVETSTDDEDDFDHLLCHCNTEIAWCGVEIELAIGTTELNGKDCPECNALGLQFVDECPYGCRCTSTMRMLHCAGEDDE